MARIARWLGLALWLAAAGCARDAEERQASRSTEPTADNATPDRLPASPMDRLATRAAATAPSVAPPRSSTKPTGPTPRAVRSATAVDVGGLSLATATPGTARVEGGVVGAQYDLLDVRVGRHPGFTRVVWQMAQDDGSPRYVAALAEGDAGSYLAVELTDVSVLGMPAALEPEPGPADGAVTGVASVPVRDDAVLAFAVGLRGPVRFAVATLQDPLRIVLDVYEEVP